jgi:gamma-glutamylcyclotransferase (GGCT)/AIG2-like uncharacterized protein YtfP
MVRYFAFGANMSGRVLARRGIAAARSEPACLADHRLVFDQAGLPFVEPAFASLVPAAGQTVWGVLYDLTEVDVARLDRFETSDYVPVEVSVVGSRSGPTAARAYRTRRPVPERRPSARYLALLCEGAREHGLPVEYVRDLAARPSAYVPVLSELMNVSVRGIEWLFLIGVGSKGRRRRG